MQSKPQNRHVTAAPILPVACPAPAFCAAARAIVTDPARYANRPIARRLAWITLLAERGNRADQTRLAQLQAGMAR